MALAEIDRAIAAGVRFGCVLADGDAHIAENGFATNGGLNKSAKVVLGRVLINRDCSAIAGCHKRRVQMALDAQAIFRRRRHQPRRPPLARCNNSADLSVAIGSRMMVRCAILQGRNGW
jgi:hypothetical protein